MGDVIDKVISEESLIRRKWLTVDQAAEKIVAFENRFGSEHLQLACHAAFPKILTPELINLLRINFLDQDDFPWIAEQDFLLSSLCRPVGDSLFEVEPRVREVLLVQLEDDFGREQTRNLAEFLLAYTESSLGGQQKAEINQLLRWIALAYVSPETLVEELTQNLIASVSTEGTGAHSLASQIKVATAYELVADALERSLPPEEYRGLAVNSRLMAYYWYGDRVSLRQNVKEVDANRQAQRPDTADTPLTIFLDWVRYAPSDLPPAVNEELPLSIARSEWGKLEEERFDLSRQQLEDIPGLIKDYRAVVVVGTPGPARTEFVRLLAERLRPNVGAQLYIDLMKDYLSALLVDVVDIQSAVIKKLRPSAEVPLDAEVVDATYRSLLSEQSTLVVIDNLATLEIDHLIPPQKSLLIATSVDAQERSASVYVVNFDERPQQEESSIFSLNDMAFLQDRLIHSSLSTKGWATLLAVLPPEIRRVITSHTQPFVYASKLLNHLLTNYPQRLTQLLDILFDQTADAKIRDRLLNIKRKVSPPEAVEIAFEEQPRTNWPKGTRFFVDRVEQLADIRRVLLNEEKRKVIVVDGPPGIGKTAFVAKALEDLEVQRAFPGGLIWLSERNLYSDKVDMLKSIALHLGLEDHDGIFDFESYLLVARRLRRELIERGVIIVLDGEFDAEGYAALINELSPPAIIWATRAFSGIETYERPIYRITLGPLPLSEVSVELLKKLTSEVAKYLPAMEQLVADTEGIPERIQELARSIDEAEGWVQSPIDKQEQISADPESTPEADSALEMPHVLPPAPDLDDLFPTASPTVVARIENAFLAEAERVVERVGQGVRAITVNGKPSNARKAFTRVLAERLARELPDAQFYFDIQRVPKGFVLSSEDYIASQVIQAFGLIPLPLTSAPELLKTYHAALNGRRVLIVIDNVELEKLSYLDSPPGNVIVGVSRWPNLFPEAYIVALDSMIEAIESGEIEIKEETADQDKPFQTERSSQDVILVVDDDEIFLKAIKYVLENERYKVITASDVAAARRLVRTESIDLLVLDIDDYDPNDKSRLGLARDLDFRRVPIIGYTSHIDTLPVRAALRSLMGEQSLFADIIEKRGPPDQLLLTIERELKKRASTDGAIQFYSCFISYSSTDEEFAGRLYSRLQDEGIRVWYAPKHVQPGEQITEQIDQAIRSSDKVLLILSENSLHSQWIVTEIRRTRELELRENRRKLFPIRIVDYEAIDNWQYLDAETGRNLATEIRQYYIPNFSNWKDPASFEAAFSGLLRGLRRSEL